MARVETTIPLNGRVTNEVTDVVYRELPGNLRVATVKQRQSISVNEKDLQHSQIQSKQKRVKHNLQETKKDCY